MSFELFEGREVTPRTTLFTNIARRLFGCHHHDLSRPFTHDGESYKSCLTCGARKRFNPETYKMEGRFYYASPRQN